MPPRLPAGLLRFMPLIATILFLGASTILFVLQTELAQEDASREISLNLDDAAGRIERNRRTLEALRAESDEQSIAKTRAFASAIALDPTLLSSPSRLEAYRKMLNVDELHVADERGVLTASTKPGYVGYRYDSDPQSAVFMLAVDYPAFALAQRPMPKGIDKELFQYTGVARIERRGIVQTGYRPERLQRAMEAADIAKIATDMRIGKSGALLVADLDGTIQSAGSETLLGRQIAEAGFERHRIKGEAGECRARVEGTESYCRYRVTDEYLLVGWIPMDELYSMRNRSMLAFTLTGLCALILPAFAMASTNRGGRGKER
ncbi:hypothetical protein [Chlorobium sp. N1]|uniref:hypothetical protein n=1 Tax=Chlorobium sp. N1 TaxID=2491138 RepID=UPI00103D00BA|nr:hypothetical protein [Chlorobium sp. N1]TCD46999.1 hypothetical protein E0L29_10200 [Chlorobium sp. N1]